jgi:cholesterol oxidase
VIDGSAVSANPGVNPSLTITALAERAMSFIPAKTAGAALAGSTRSATSVREPEAVHSAAHHARGPEPGAAPR